MASSRRAIVSALAAAMLSTSVNAQDVAGGSVSAPPQPADGRLVIWNNLRLGMTKAEVKALYPKKLFPLTEGCHAVVNTVFDAKGLAQVNLEWSLRDNSAKRCGVMVGNTLQTKYGEPLAVEREVKGNDCGNEYAGGLAGALAGLCKATGGEEPDYYEYRRWHSEGIEITFKTEPKKDDPNWYAVYRPIEGMESAEAAGKL